MFCFQEGNSLAEDTIFRLCEREVEFRKVLLAKLAFLDAVTELIKKDPKRLNINELRKSYLAGLVPYVCVQRDLA